MTIEGTVFDRGRISPETDSLIFKEIYGDGNRILTKHADRLKVTSSGLNIYVAKGAALIEGRLIRVTDQERIVARANDKGFVVLTIDLTQTNTSTGTPGTDDYVAVNRQIRIELVNDLVQQNLSNNGKIYNFPLASYTSNGTSVSLSQSATMMVNNLTILNAPDVSNAPNSQVNLNTSVMDLQTIVEDPCFVSDVNGRVRCIKSGVYSIRTVGIANPPSVYNAANFKAAQCVAYRNGVEGVFLTQFVGRAYNGGQLYAEGFIQLQEGDLLQLRTDGNYTGTVSFFRAYIQRL